MQSPDILDIVPEHVVDPVRRAPWRVRVLTGFGDALLSLVLNGAVVGCLIGVDWPLPKLEAPAAISVDLVDHMPEPKGSGAGSGSAASPPAGADVSKREVATAAKEAVPARHDEPQAIPAPPPAPTAEPGPAPEAPAANPAAETSAVAQAEPAQSSSASAEPKPQPATPPTPERPDNNPAPRLVEAPSAPPRPPISAEPRDTPAAVPPLPLDPAAQTASTEPSPGQPVRSAAADADAVPPPSPPKPLTAAQKRQADNTAKLAAMLPFGTNITADPFQAQSPAEGRGTSDAYRGLVYANFNKAGDVIEDAKARHLKGQAVVAFTVDDQGGIASIGVAVSSGNPAVDQAALALIRKAAPFPPPPPGAPRAFSPAIGLGLDE